MNRAAVRDLAARGLAARGLAARALAPRGLAAGRSPSARLNRASGILALCVLADSAIEHYRGSFHNPAMVVPLVASALEATASAHRLAQRGRPPHRVRRGVHALAIATGLIGSAFHVYNIRKRSGGYSFMNFFYGAPIAAPGALVLSGLLGLAAERVRRPAPFSRLFRRRSERSAGRLLALLTSLGIAGTVAEAALLHFRGAFHNKAMYLPVTLPPLAAAALGTSALSSNPGIARAARRLLRAVGLLGVAGTAFHTYGISRGMGGFRNWTQNVLDGPPLPAPPGFTALALAGLAALELQDAERR